MPGAPRSSAGRPRSRWDRGSRRSWHLLLTVPQWFPMARSTSREPRAKLQPGTIAEKRPAVPPATTTFRLSGSRHFGISVVSDSAQHVLGQPVAAVAAGHELAHGAPQAVPQELSDTRLVPTVVADDPSVLGTQDDERVSPVGHLVALHDRQAAHDGGEHVRG